MTSLDTIYNFAKFQFIEKYWNQTVPTDYPEDATVTFSTKYDSEETRVAVKDMEASLGTEESVVTDALPENTYVTNYLGTYNVDMLDQDQEPGAEGTILLSPVKVENSDAVSGVVAMHYNEATSTWENITDAHITDGYVYGTVTSLSPIAVFTVRKDIEVKEGYLWKGLIAVFGNGNPIRIYKNENDEGIVENKITGKKYTLTDTETVVFGGSWDGTALDSTSITVEAGVYNKLDIKAGSHSPSTQTTVGTVNLSMTGATLLSISGSCGCVRTDLVNFTITDSKYNWMGTGESITYMANGQNIDANKDYTPETVNTFSSPFWTKKVNVNLTNVTTSLGYIGPNTGMTYTKEIVANITGGNIDYLLMCASNGHTGDIVATINGTTGTYFQTNNRGIVDSVKATVKDATIENMFVAGDNTDSTVTGFTKNINIDIGAGTYTLIPGTQNGIEMTSDVAAETVGKVKYSRSATMTFAENTKAVLGDKLVLK